MEVELHSLPQSTRTKLQPRLRNYKNDLSKLKKDLVSTFSLFFLSLFRLFHDFSFNQPRAVSLFPPLLIAMSSSVELVGILSRHQWTREAVFSKPTRGLETRPRGSRIVTVLLLNQRKLDNKSLETSLIRGRPSFAPVTMFGFLPS